MTLKKKVFIVYTSQIYVAIIGLVMLPVYLHYLGIESYALVGFSAMLFVWLQLLDMGLTPTLSRELSRYRAGVVSRIEALQLLNNLEWCFGLLSGIIFVFFFSASPWIAAHWLKPEHLSVGEITLCLKIIGAMAGCRWLSGLFSAGLVGLGEQVIVGLVQIVMATIKSVGVVLVIVYLSSTLEAFFIFQGCVTVFEMLWMRSLINKQLDGGRVILFPQLEVLQRIKKFAGAMAFLTMIWVVITQIDKLLLSNILPLKEYGYFILSTSAASIITMVAVPFNQIVQPQLTKLRAQNKQEQLISLYRKTTQVACLILAVAAGTLAIYAEPLLLIWTGNVDVARHAERTLFWYALGNGLAGILAIPFWLQFAYGNLRYHVAGNIIFGVIWIPTLIISAYYFGAIGVAKVWFFGNLIFLLCWVPYVHSRLAADVKWDWLFQDVCMVVGSVLVVLYSMSLYNLQAMSKSLVILFLVLAAMLATLAGSIAGDKIRPIVLAYRKKMR